MTHNNIEIQKSESEIIQSGKFQEHIIRGLENPFKLSHVKEFIGKVFASKGYNKSPYASVDLDPWSIWFYVTNFSTGEILSAMRIVEKKPNNFIPIEMGVIYGSQPQKRYVVIEKNVADWNSVAFLRTAGKFRV